MPGRKYEFSWELLGDIQLGRPHLGPTTRLEVYRLMQDTFRDVIERRFGTEKADEVFYESGRLAGRHFYQNVLGAVAGFDQLIKSLQQALESMGIGILRVERSDLEKGEFVFSVEEDLDCSGLPELNYEICTYDEGFIAGVLEDFTGKEVDCWCTGGRTCRFEANVTS
jgi:predicted hydrocarbon binding protein